jgi:hypothetical protein
MPDISTIVAQTGINDIVSKAMHGEGSSVPGDRRSTADCEFSTKSLKGEYVFTHSIDVDDTRVDYYSHQHDIGLHALIVELDEHRFVFRLVRETH